MRQHLLVIVFSAGLFFTAPVCAQQVNIFSKDSVRLFPEKRSKFLFSFDSRRSFVNGRGAKFWGLRIGLELNWRHRFGLGFYGLTDQVVLNDVRLLVPSTDSTDLFLDTVAVRFNFNYNSLFYERVLYRVPRWEVSVPFHIGAGRITADYEDKLGRGFRPIDTPVALFEIGVNGQYNIWPWLGLGGGFGYRSMVSDDERVQEAYSAPLYMFRVKLMVGPLYRSIFNKEKEEKTIEKRR